MSLLEHRKIIFSQNAIIVWSVFIMLLLISGFRWDVGTDWQNYMNMFGADDSFLMSLSRIEPANIALNKLLQYTGMADGGYWIFAMGCLTLFFTFYTIRWQSDNPLLSIILYICLGIFFSTLNGIRQHTAVAITALSWPLLIERRFIRFFIVTLIATLFHQTALIMLPVYFLCNIKMNARLLLITGIIAIPLSFVMTPLIDDIISLFPTYEALYSSSEYASVINPMSILRVIYPFSLLLFILNAYEKVTSDRRSLTLTNIALCYIFIMLFFPGVPFAIRMGYYFELVLIIYIPFLCFRMNRSNSIILKYYTIFYGICFVIVTMLTRPIANLLPFELDFRLAGIELWRMLLCVIIVSAIFARLIQTKLSLKPNQ